MTSRKDRVRGINRFVAAMLALVWTTAGLIALAMAFRHGQVLAAIGAVFAVMYGGFGHLSPRAADLFRGANWSRHGVPSSGQQAIAASIATTSPKAATLSVAALLTTTELDLNTNGGGLCR